MKRKITFLLVLLLVMVSSSYAQLEVATIFTDNMVLQRDTEVPIWGWTEEKTPVMVYFMDKKYSATVDAKGKWRAKLPATAAGGPYEIRIEQGKNSKKLQNVLFGDIWVCSGQSNMEWTLQNSMRAKEEIAKANNTPYGLSAGVWTDKGSKIFNLTSQMRAGVVWANTYNKFDPTSPFGGYKESGYGREGGLQGLSPYVKLN